MRKSKRYDFLPNINNKYSIRKFTVGTASILVGATLIFGAAHDEAKAAEDAKTEEGATSSSNESDQPSSETANTGVETTEQATAEQPTTEESSTEESTKEEVTTEAPASQKTTADSVNVTSNDADITKVTDEKSAVEYYAQAANVSESDAEQAVSDLNLDSDNLIG